MAIGLHKAGMCLSGISGLGAVSTMGAYNGTLKTIEDEVKDHCVSKGIDAKENGIWKKVYEKNSSSFNSDEAKVFKGLENKSGKGEELKEKCEEVYSWVFKSIFHSEKNDLKTLIKKYCSLTIKEALDNRIDIPEVKTDENKNYFTKHLENLKKDNSLTDETLKGLKSSEPSDSSDTDEKWKKLEVWCEGVYKDQYTKDDLKWKQIQTYCIKS